MKRHRKQTSKPIAIVVRYSDNLAGRRVNTIDEHNRIIQSKARVFVGKMGKAIGRQVASLCQNADPPALLLLVTRQVDKGYVFYYSEISSLQFTAPPRSLVPAYYRDSSDSVSTWFELRKPLKPLPASQRNRWYLRNSGSPLIETLALSMAGYFLAVRYPAGERPNPHKRSHRERHASEDEPFEDLTSLFDDHDGSDV